MSVRPEADPQLGRTLGGQYRIDALLGAGGMGRVYRGRQLSVNRAVAIKVIAGQAPYPAEWVRRFRREAEATASLSHPNSVRVFDFGVTESEELFMVMELLEGTDLARQLQAHGPLPVVTALSVARQVLLALCEAHALGITHRDIKPDNIFLASVRGADVVAKVMDFGIAGLAQAQSKSRLTGTGVIIGTPLYMSPEQAQGLSVDGKSDVYSLGVVLFEMLTGRPVFESHTAVTLLLAHVARPPMRLDEAGVQLREQSSLQALLDRLLVKDPVLRLSAAEALDSVTTLAARLGIAGATGTMRAVSSPEPPPTAADPDLSAQAFQSARMTSAPTGTRPRPAMFMLGAGLVLSAATALALRWVPTLIEAAQPTAAENAHVATPAQLPLPRTVLINSQPSGAQVLVHGEQVGTTPFRLELLRDTEISVARQGYARQLVSVAYEARSPLLVKLVAQPNAKATGSDAPFHFSFKQAKQPRIEARPDGDHERRERTTGGKARGERAPGIGTTQAPDVLQVPEVAMAQPPEPSDGPELERAGDVEPGSGNEVEANSVYRIEREREAELAAEHGESRGEDGAERDLASERARRVRDSEERNFLSERERARREVASASDRMGEQDAETSRSAATRVEAMREDELSEIALDDDERAHVSKHYGLRALGRAVARAVGRLLIPYPSRERRAALAQLPLMYPSFRDARAAYKHAEIDGTGFQEAVWQLRERRRKEIGVERDRYARGQLSQSQYEARLDRIWDEFWGSR